VKVGLLSSAPTGNHNYLTPLSRRLQQKTKRATANTRLKRCRTFIRLRYTMPLAAFTATVRQVRGRSVEGVGSRPILFAFVSCFLLFCWLRLMEPL
jgi:hypothetical protein